MNCRALLETLTEYLDDTAAAAVRADLEAHLAECKSCTVIVETSRRTLKIVTDVGSFDIPQDLSERLLRKTMDALASGKKESPRSGSGDGDAEGGPAA